MRKGERRREDDGVCRECGCRTTPLPAPPAQPVTNPSPHHRPRPLQGLPVFYAPGEAEATCAALAALGAVDACASFDSDTLVYGAERVYHTLKLSVRR